MKNLSKAIIIGCLLLVCVSSNFYAANESFTASLLQYQADNEVSTVRKGYKTSYFTVTIDSIEKGANSLCVWTEDAFWGTNFSSPYYQIGHGTGNINYSSIPSVGTNVTLNIDNPVYSNKTYTVKGSWTPW